MTEAIALFSGGLDSSLAIKVVLEQGIKITALHFTTPFCQCDRHKSARLPRLERTESGPARQGCRSEAHLIAEKFGIPFKIIDQSREFLEMLQHPKHGYGRQMNPCIDCRIMMLCTAREYMEKIGASFIITGEVLGQRPMSQHKQALKLIERESVLEGLILRPLSARLLEPTIPEKQGLVDRSKLLMISGRSRKEQITLAEVFQIKDYACPAGGCLLTDPAFSIRLKDLFEYGKLNINEALFLKLGRHFRLDESTKLVVGRNERENKVILSLTKANDVVIDMTKCPGPAGLLRSVSTPSVPRAIFQLACGITARYADLLGKPGKAEIRQKDGKAETIKVTPLPDNEVRKYLIGSE